MTARKHVPLPPCQHLNAFDSLLSIACCNFTLLVLDFPHKFIVKLNNTEITVELSVIHSIIIICTNQDRKQIN